MSLTLLLLIVVLCSLRIGANSLSTANDIGFSIFADACTIVAAILLYSRAS